MKLLYDQNLSSRLVTVLAAEFPQAQHLRNLGMGSASDTQIWQYARANAYMIVTKDSDLHQWSLLLGQPPKVVWLRVATARQKL